MATSMRFNQSEIIEDILEHVRRQGGVPSGWCAGTAKNPTLFDGPHSAGGSEGLIYREAYTSYAAAEVVERLQGSGLLPDRTALCARGDFVYVHRCAATKPRVSVSNVAQRYTMSN